MFEKKTYWWWGSELSLEKRCSALWSEWLKRNDSVTQNEEGDLIVWRGLWNYVILAKMIHHHTMTRGSALQRSSTSAKANMSWWQQVGAEKQEGCPPKRKNMVPLLRLQSFRRRRGSTVESRSWPTKAPGTNLTRLTNRVLTFWW